MSSVKQVTQQSFEQEVLQSPTPVLIDFYSDWCGPCQRLAPTLQRLAAEFAGRVKIVKIDVEAEQELANEFRIESIPTLAVVVDGKLADRTSGLVSEAHLRSALARLSGAAAPRRVG